MFPVFIIGYKNPLERYELFNELNTSEVSSLKCVEVILKESNFIEKKLYELPQLNK